LFSPRYRVGLPSLLSFPTRRSSDLEPYLHTLGLTRQKEDAINSLMRGISVADSAPIPDTDLTLVQKVDLRTDGQEQRPNLVRERSEEHTSELQSRFDTACRLPLELQ